MAGPQSVGCDCSRSQVEVVSCFVFEASTGFRLVSACVCRYILERVNSKVVAEN